MILPGWNVSEPIDLAWKLYDVIESFKSAPEDAKAFVSRVNKFSRALKELQKTINNDTALRSSSAQDLDLLRATLVDCQDVVKRCEAFSEQFQKLVQDGGGSIAGAQQATRWVWKDKKVARLNQEIDNQMVSISVTLMIKTLYAP